MDPAKYELHKEDMRIRMNAKTAAAQEIGPLPEITDPELRAACEFNLKLFATKFVPGLFKGVTKKFSKMHDKAFEDLQDKILHGGLEAIAMPRGSAKTAMIKAAVIWAACYGHCKFCVVVCAANDLAKRFLQSVKKQLRLSRKILECFPEVAYPIRLIKDKHSRAVGQTLNGQRTAIEWLKDHIVLPTVPGSAASGFRVSLSGILGSGLRGLVEALEEEDCEEVRPDIVIIDDPSTKKSARSVTQNDTRLEIIKADILGMGGPGEKMSAFAAVTVVEPNDVADQLLSDPSWNPIRFGILTKFPSDEAMEHWHKYNEILSECRVQKRGVGPANEYYRENRSVMDGDWEATWPDRFNSETEISGVQHAMNLYFERGPKAWWAEFGNDPQGAIEEAIHQVTQDEVKVRLSKVPRHVVPMGFAKITMQIDVGHDILWYVVKAYKQDFTSSVIDYGWYPDQGGRRMFSLDNLTQTIYDVSGCHTTDVHGAVTHALNKLGQTVLARKYYREDRMQMEIAKCLVDINYEQSASAVGEFCRLSPWSSRLIPARGYARTEKRPTPISQWTPKPGQFFPTPAEREQCQWMLTSPRNHLLAEARFDTNHWRGRVLRAVSQPLYSAGAMSLYGDNPAEHEMLAIHLASHRGKYVTMDGVDVLVYNQIIGMRDDLLDGVMGCDVAASMEQIKLPTEQIVADIVANDPAGIIQFPESRIVRKGSYR